MIKNSKGFSAIDAIVIIIIVLLVLVFVPTFMSMAQKGVTKTEQVGTQVGTTLNVLPKDWYKITVVDAIKGELTLNVLDKKGTNDTSDDEYITAFSPVTDYKVYEDGVQRAVTDVQAYPTSYIVLVGDPNSAAGNMLGALSNLSVENSYLGVILMTSSTTPPEFKSPKESATAAVNDMLSVKGISSMPADYWGALANAKQSLPTVTAMRDFGPNFLAVVLVSDGRCDAGADICNNETAISQALSMPASTHFYLLTSDCNPSLTNPLNVTLETYVNLVRDSCYTSVDDLYTHLLKDMYTIKVEYEPKFVFVGPIESAPYHNITVTITKRTGVLGAQSAYSGTTTVRTSQGY